MPPETHSSVPKSVKKDSLSIPIAIVFAGILIAGAILVTDKPATTVQQANVAVPSANPTGADTNTVPEDLLKLKADDHILGNPDANIVVIEYSDAQCPFCQRFHDVMKQVMNDYAKSGEVAWVYRHFPLDQIHPYARKGGEALECANEQGGNDAFWKMVDEVFAPETTSIASDQLPLLAQKAGLNVDKFNACVSSGKFATRVQRDFAEGVQVGVKGTPFSIVWNRKTGKQMSINGAYPYDNVKTVLGLVASDQPATP